MTLASTIVEGGIAPNGQPLLDVTDLKMHFRMRKGLFGRRSYDIRAVDGVSLRVVRGETLGLVGESGCGKTTLGRCIMRVHRPTSGRILFHDDELSHQMGSVGNSGVDVSGMDQKRLRAYYRSVRMVFQDPFAALNPRMTLLQLISEPLRMLGMDSRVEIEARVGSLLGKVGLRTEYMNRYPHAFSGGERQRVVIARAMAVDPQLVVADEAVSALDVSVRAQILNLLEDLQEEHGLAYLFISHDLSVVEHISHRVAVMYLGKIVELGPTDALYRRPLHPYTEALIAAVPKPDPRRPIDRQRLLQGDLPDPSNPPSGCAFRTRCRYAQDVCAEQTPPLQEMPSGRYVACHFAEDLQLVGLH